MKKISLLILIVCSVGLTILNYFSSENSLKRSDLGEEQNNAHYMILLIGDGMGYEQIRAARNHLYGPENKKLLSFEKFPHKSEMGPEPAEVENGELLITDSAAAATAMATGKKVQTGVLSVRLPGKAERIETILEHYQKQGFGTGLVTSSRISHATPAAFAAHLPSRHDYWHIETAYLKESRPNVLMGGRADGYFIDESLLEAGYKNVTNRELLAAGIADQKVMHLASLYDGGKKGHLKYTLERSPDHEDQANLSELSIAALKFLKQRFPKGFFIVIEGARIDHAGHSNNIYNNIRETQSFHETVKKVQEWAEKQNAKTTLLVTADHETGGLELHGDSPKGVWPAHTWSTGWHTDQKVPVYAWGYASEKAEKIRHNTDVYHFFKNIVPPSSELAAKN